MKFKNRRNECVETIDGRQVWLSRSVAVAVCILVVVEGEPYILINQRGSGVPDFQGYWNLPCGYLDYDETTEEAAIREVWEECGVNLVPVLEGSVVEFFTRPWDINSRPTHAKQNVTIHHGLAAILDELPPVSDENNEPNETTDIRWVRLDEVHRYRFAFNHQRRIKKFVEHLADVTELNFIDRLGNLD